MMAQTVLLKIHTVQIVPGDAPEVMELQTEGTLRRFEDRVEISYVETRITGLEGVTGSVGLAGCTGSCFRTSAFPFRIPPV